MMDARAITHALNGTWYGQHGLCPSPGHSRKDRGMKVWDAPTLSDGIGIHLHLFNGDGDGWKDARQHLVNNGLLSGGFIKLSFEQIQSAKTKREAEQRDAHIKKQARARTLWQRSLPIAGTPAETYLRHERKCKGLIPDTVRYLPECSFYMTHDSSTVFPAMIARIDDYNRPNDMAVQCTFLTPDGRKHPLAGRYDAPRKIIGKALGAAIRLGSKCEVMGIAEGFESAFSFRDYHKVRCDAALAGNGLASWNPPKGLKVLAIAHDNDRTGRDKAARLSNRLIPMGIDVRLVPAPEGFNDWNDHARGKKA